MANLRIILATAIPTLGALLGFLWFRRKKKQPSIEDKPAKVLAECPKEEVHVASKEPESQPRRDVTAEVKPEDDVIEASVVSDVEAAVEALIQVETMSQCSQAPSLSVKQKSAADNEISAEEVPLVEEMCIAAEAPCQLQAALPSHSAVPSATKTDEAVISGEEDSGTAELSSDEELVAANGTPQLNGHVSEEEERSSSVHKDSSDKRARKVSKGETNNNGPKVTEGTVAVVKPMMINTEESVESEDPKGKSREGSLDSEEGVADMNGHASTCDANSEVSSDSGKGTSVSENSQASSPTGLPEIQTHEFTIPSEYVGLMIGRAGRNIQMLKTESGADIQLHRNPFTPDMQLCVLTGTNSQITAALESIKRRFPEKRFPGINYESMKAPPVLTPQIMQMSLPEGVSVDVIVSSVVDVNHIFVQQPTHPTFSSLDRLNICMNQCYTAEGDTIPELPRPVEPGVICVAPMFNGWYRAQVVATHNETDECDVKFVDYGGYMRFQSASLKQIRTDFTSLPFQAVECYLSNVVPPKESETFAPEAQAFLEQLVHGKMLQAQIVSHEEDGVPYIHLYHMTQNMQPAFINREVVDQGFARWFEMT